MAEYTRELNLPQGYNFKKDVQLPIGFLTKLQIGTELFVADQTVNSPVGVTAGSGVETTATAEKGTLKVVGVLNNITWAMGDTDAIIVKGTISIAGKQAFSGLLYASMIDIDVTFGFVVYEYDPLAKKYYTAFSNGNTGAADGGLGATDLLGQIQKDGENLKMSIEPEPNSEVQSPMNYGFELGIVPKPQQQLVYFATSATRKTTKNWGRDAPRS